MRTRTPVTTTPRLLLTRPHPDDSDWVFAIHGDPATNQHNPHGPHASIQDSTRFLTSMLADWERDAIGYCAVTTRQDPTTVIGFAGTRLSDLAGDRVLNLYYRFTPTTWGQGIAQEAAHAALDLARTRFPTSAVVALIRADNQPSKRLAERLGLHPTHTRDTAGRDIWRLSPTELARPGAL